MLGSSVDISERGEELILSFGGDSARGIDAGTLWTECRSASARRRRIEGTQLPVPRNLKITEAHFVGHYGLHVAFSADPLGGVFPWSQLLELSQRPQMRDFILP